MFGFFLNTLPSDLATISMLQNLGFNDAKWSMLQISTGDAHQIDTRYIIMHERIVQTKSNGAVCVEKEKSRWKISSREDTSYVEGKLTKGLRLSHALLPYRVPQALTENFVAFEVSVKGPSFHQTMDRLLALGMDDFHICRTDTALWVQCQKAPFYMLTRAHEEAEDIRPYVRQGDSKLWLEYGYELPTDARAKEVKVTTFMDGNGVMRAFENVREESLADGLMPDFKKRKMTLTPAQGPLTQYEVKIRMGEGPMLEPSLWIVDAAQAFALEPIVDEFTSDEISRLTVTSVQSAEGRVRYMLREIVKNDVSPLGVRVSDVLGQSGFMRAEGCDNLYFPVGRGIVPRMRQSELAKVLHLDTAQIVIIEETDGEIPVVNTVKGTSPTALSAWIEYQIRRGEELETTQESVAFSHEPIIIEAPVRAKAEKTQQAEDHLPKAPRMTKFERSTVKLEKPVAVPKANDSAAQIALRESVRRAEEVLAKGGHSEAVAWRALAALKIQTGDVEDAAMCFESALFYSGAKIDGSDAKMLLSIRAKQQAAKDGFNEALALCAKEKLLPSEMALLGAHIIAHTQQGVRGVEVLHRAAIKIFADQSANVSTKLSWAVLSCIARYSKDTLGMTRSREQTIGKINVEGMSENFDLPRFVRHALAEQDAKKGDAQSVKHAEQINALQTLWNRTVPLHLKEGTDIPSKGQFLRLTFAVGFARLGSFSMSRELSLPVEAAMHNQEVPVQALLNMYRAKTAHVSTQGDHAQWVKEADAIFATVKDPRAADRVTWLRKRSEWLRSSPPDESPPGMRATLAKTLASVETQPKMLYATLQKILEEKELYDYEITVAVQYILRFAIRAGNDDIIQELVQLCTAKVPSRIPIVGHRARAIGECLRAAAIVQDTTSITKLLNEISTMARAPEAPSVRDLLSAVSPGLNALRRLGIADTAKEFLASLLPIAEKDTREAIKLRAALSDGYLQLRDAEKAEALITSAMKAILHGSLDHVAKYDGGCAILAASHHWPMQKRMEWCNEFIDKMDHFTDTFTATLTKLYETHKILISERIVDAIVDASTVQSDRVRMWLEDEEKAVRRRIIADCRAMS